jgi:hypothetical protein
VASTPQLQDYIYRTRRLLRDSNATFWSNADLIIYINQARNDVCLDTGCCRYLGLITLNQAQEVYNLQLVLSQAQQAGLPAYAIGGVLGCTLDWTSSFRFALEYLPWEDFNATYRVLSTLQYVPGIWSMFDQQNFYVAPLPNGTYTLEVDSVWVPSDLVNLSDTETAIPPPFNDMLVPVMAAFWAKYYEQAYNEAKEFASLYLGYVQRKMGQLPGFRVPSRYRSTLAY